MLAKNIQEKCPDINFKDERSLLLLYSMDRPRHKPIPALELIPGDEASEEFHCEYLPEMCATGRGKDVLDTWHSYNTFVEKEEYEPLSDILYMLWLTPETSAPVVFPVLAEWISENPLKIDWYFRHHIDPLAFPQFISPFDSPRPEALPIFQELANQVLSEALKAKSEQEQCNGVFGAYLFLCHARQEKESEDTNASATKQLLSKFLPLLKNNWEYASSTWDRIHANNKYPFDRGEEELFPQLVLESLSKSFEDFTTLTLVNPCMMWNWDRQPNLLTLPSVAKVLAFIKEYEEQSRPTASYQNFHYLHQYLLQYFKENGARDAEIASLNQLFDPK